MSFSVLINNPFINTCQFKNLLKFPPNCSFCRPSHLHLYLTEMAKFSQVDATSHPSVFIASLNLLLLTLLSPHPSCFLPYLLPSLFFYSSASILASTGSQKIKSSRSTIKDCKFLKALCHVPILPDFVSSRAL